MCDTRGARRGGSRGDLVTRREDGAGSLGCGVAVLAAMTTLAPRAASDLPISRPIPRDPPVMNAVRPARDSAGMVKRQIDG